MTADQIRAALADRILTVVSKRTGIHYNTLRNFIKNRHETNPETIAKLEAYLKQVKR